MNKDELFQVRIDADVLKKLKDMLDSLPQSTIKDRFASLVQAAAAGLAVSNIGGHFECHMQAINDSLENIRNETVSIITAADEQRKLEHSELLDTLKIRDRTIAQLQETNDVLQGELDKERVAASTATEAQHVAEKAADESRRAATEAIAEAQNAFERKTAEYEEVTKELRCRVEEQSRTINELLTAIELQREKMYTMAQNREDALTVHTALPTGDVPDCDEMETKAE